MQAFIELLLFTFKTPKGEASASPFSCLDGLGGSRGRLRMSDLSQTPPLSRSSRCLGWALQAGGVAHERGILYRIQFPSSSPRCLFEIDFVSPKTIPIFDQFGFKSSLSVSSFSRLREVVFQLLQKGKAYLLFSGRTTSEASMVMSSFFEKFCLSWRRRMAWLRMICSKRFRT